MDAESAMVPTGSSGVSGRMEMDENGKSVVEVAVEPLDVIDTEKHVFDPTPSPPRIATPPKIEMPTRADLSQIPFHSPSSQIIGTPFATNSTKFEYPFPDSSSSSGNSSPPSSTATSPSACTLSMPISVIAVSPPLSSCGSFPILSTATLHTGSTPVVSMSLPSLGLTYPPLSPSEMPSYNQAHPKLRTTIPPIPPSLVKKRIRWTLALGLGSIGRRRSSSSNTSGSPNGSPGSENPRRFGPSPLGSPGEEQGSKN